jgi:short-subunit dehydrogenase
MENSFAVVTGASNGMGLEFAKQLGQSGFELLIASNTDEIFEAQRGLEALGYMVEAMKINLATFSGVELLTQRIQSYGKVLDAIVINASTGPEGLFTETDLREEINSINSNIVSTIHIMKRILPEMKLRGKGKILVTASSTNQNTAFNDVIYGASKSFLLSFSESLRTELHDSGISITTLLPGGLYSIESTGIARQGFEAMMDGRDYVFADKFLTKLQEYAFRILPEKAKAQISRKWSESSSNQH